MLLSFLKSLEALLKTPKFLLSKDAAAYYQHLGDDVLEGEHEKFVDAAKPLWLNLGYWESARNYPDACVAMAELIAGAAKLAPGIELLDVGFGFAEQDFFWLERYGLKRIAGVNITPLHVEKAQARARERGLEDRLDLGSDPRPSSPSNEIRSTLSRRSNALFISILGNAFLPRRFGSCDRAGGSELPTCSQHPAVARPTW